MTTWADDLQDSRILELPGGDMILSGLEELEHGKITECGLLVLVASIRLQELGLKIPVRNDIERPVNLQLYALLCDKYHDGAYSRYNAMQRTLSSFIHALEHRRSQCIRLNT